MPVGKNVLHAQGEMLRIGLLLPDSTFPHIEATAKQAVKEANREGSNRHTYELVIRYAAGPWGMGSKQSVSLVYDDEVLAMVGWLDGRNAHLAEQVAAKSHIPYLETRATDPTLSQAYVPWFFRMTPSDDQQARAILELIAQGNGQRLAILKREDYETRYAVKSLMKEAGSQTGRHPLMIPVPQEDSDVEAVLSQLQSARIRNLIVPVLTPPTLALLRNAVREIPDLKIFGTLTFTTALEEYHMEQKNLPVMKLIHSYTTGDQMPEPSLSAAYVYDGIRLIIQAIEEVDADRELLKTHLTKIEGFRGLTGPAAFDEMGNRIGELRFIHTKD
jgi:ABC-type branched-subunit amino acid transport system substrate-binding protein